MKLWFRELWTQLVVALITGIPLSILAGVASQVFAGDWRKWFGIVPWWGYLSVVVVILVVTSIRAYNVAARNVATEKYPPYDLKDDGGWVPVREQDHAGVRWQLVAREFQQGQRTPDDWHEYWERQSVRVVPQPYCVKCAANIMEGVNWLRFVVWRCPRPGCGWRRWHTHSFKTVCYEVEAVAIPDLMAEIQKKHGQNEE